MPKVIASMNVLLHMSISI